MGKISGKRKPVVPQYAVFPLLSCVILNFIVYTGTDLLAGSWKHYDLTLPIDRAVPVIPGFVAVYLGCYVFWIVNYILIARQDKKQCYQFFTADFLSRIICLIFFVVFPTTNIRPNVAGPGFWNLGMRILYTLDTPVNLFPSIHCLVSWFCYIGLRGDKRVPLWYRRFSCAAAVSVFLSTLFVKQHVLIDVAGAVVLAELCQRLGRLPVLWKSYGRIFDRLNSLFISHLGQRDQRRQYS